LGIKQTNGNGIKKKRDESVERSRVERNDKKG
jgi:hypothetical protein